LLGQSERIFLAVLIILFIVPADILFNTNRAVYFTIWAFLSILNDPNAVILGEIF